MPDKKLTSDRPNLPNYVRSEWKDWLPDLNLIFRLLAGTRSMHEHASEYIRKWTDEDQKVFNIRSTIEQVFEGLGRTLSAAIGMLFAKPPAVEWGDGNAQGLMEKHLENVDGSGTSAAVFTKRFSESAIRDGLGLILVDFPLPAVDSDGETVEVNSLQEKEWGLRPTWASYDRANIRNWRIDSVDNQEVFTLLVLHEPGTVNDGEFGIAIEHRWRILRLGLSVSENDPDAEPQLTATWELKRLLPDKQGMEASDYATIDGGTFRNKDGEAATRIPISVAYAGRKESAMVATPPLLGVAWACLGLWQISSNVRFYLDLVCFPQPTVIGDLAMSLGTMDKSGNRIQVPGKLKMGPMVAVHLTAGDKDSGGPSEYKFTSPASDGFVPNEKAMQRKREDIAALGMSFLDRDKRAAETAEAKRMDATAENATLATAAQGIDDCLNKVLKIHAWYMGLEEGDQPTISLNRDFESTVMDSSMMEAWISGVEKAGLPPHVLLKAWQKGGQIPEGIDLDELELEMLSLIESERAAQEAEAEESRFAQEESEDE